MDKQKVITFINIIQLLATKLYEHLCTYDENHAITDMKSLITMAIESLEKCKEMAVKYDY